MSKPTSPPIDNQQTNNQLVNNQPTSDIKETLQSYFADVNTLEDELGEQAAEYVFSGEQEQVLAKLGRLNQAAAILQLKVCERYPTIPEEKGQQFFQKLAPYPLLCFRLGLVYEAAARIHNPTLSITYGPGIPPWLEILLWQASNGSPNWYRNSEQTYLPHETLEGVLQAAKESTDLVLRVLLTFDTNWSHYSARALLKAIPGLKEASVRHPSVVEEFLQQPKAQHRLHVLELLSQAGCLASPHVQTLTLLALDSAKTVRQAAEAWLRTAIKESIPFLQQYAQTGSTQQRMYAIELLWRFEGEKQLDFLQARRKVEKTDSVLQTIDGILTQTAPSAETASSLQLPPVSVGPLPELSSQAFEALQQIANNWYQDAVRHFEAYKKQGPVPILPSEANIKEWLTLLSDAHFTLKKARRAKWKILNRIHIDNEHVLKPILALPELTLGHVIRLAALTDLLREDEDTNKIKWMGGLFGLLQVYEKSKKANFGLREIAAELEAISVPSDAVGIEILYSYRGYRRFDTQFQKEQIWPYFVENLVLLEKALGLHPSPLEMRTRQWYLKEARLNALDIIKIMPTPPPSLQNVLWTIALGSVKTERILAQQALDSVAGATERILVALANNNQDTREIAAQWLANHVVYLETTDASKNQKLIASIKTALLKATKQEKKERPKAAMMQTLEYLGLSVDEFLDRTALQKEAQNMLAKGIPTGLSWFPFGELPQVHWLEAPTSKNKKDTKLEKTSAQKLKKSDAKLTPTSDKAKNAGTLVDQKIVTFWLVQAYKLGSPEPGPILRRYAAQLVPAQANALGRFILNAWLAYDVALPTLEEAKAKAAKMNFGSYMSVDDWIKQFLQHPQQSAISQKGILAVVGAFAQESVAPLVGRYLKEWYGMRSGQCKALLQMLSWVEHPSAIQLLLQTATRFRTPGIRTLAEACVKEVAERKGWSMDELADRTIPSAHLNEQGILEISYGAGKRTFLAKLDPQFKLRLETKEGKSIANLPEARSDEDQNIVKEAKQLLTSAKKQIQTVIQQQKERLYEAMCIERTWKFSDWQTYLASHPLMKRLCEQVIWMVFPKETNTKEAVTPITFRPIGDGTFSNAEDHPVVIAEDAKIGVAHPLLLPENIRTAWIQHLADYEVESLFPQFSRKLYILPPEEKESTAIHDFAGYVLEAFQLRNRATKLGYIRGPAEDGGWFWTYKKRFPSLGITAEIQFSGNSLPEENRKVAIQLLQFQQGGENESFEQILPLSQVKAVLLSECFNDIKEIAAEGAFDEKWQTTVSI